MCRDKETSLSMKSRVPSRQLNKVTIFRRPNQEISGMRSSHLWAEISRKVRSLTKEEELIQMLEPPSLRYQPSSKMINLKFPRMMVNLNRNFLQITNLLWKTRILLQLLREVWYMIFSYLEITQEQQNLTEEEEI